MSKVGHQHSRSSAQAGATLPVFFGKNSVWQKYFLATLADKAQGLPRQGCGSQQQESGALPNPTDPRPQLAVTKAEAGVGQ
ncbi:hypothetical protein WJX79_005193 [Trebouxia sp. C0005]